MDAPRDPDFAARLFGGRREHTLALLRAAWPAAVGPDLARRTEVVALDRGILRVKVPDPRWQRTLLRLRGTILGRLRTVAGDLAPRGLGFVTGGVAAPPGPAAAAADSLPADPRADVRSADAPPAAPPLPPAGLVEAAGAIPDPELRARFLAAASRYVGRFGGDRDRG
ncbi:MAG TPA: DUF721 domain-containing protein [Vicinamibacteria bacterium]